jgi:putative flippase GtrA
LKLKLKDLPETLNYYLKFNAVGAAGILVQLVTLTVLRGIFGVYYLLATFLAVETAILHNFIWHQRWTWSERPVQTTKEILFRLLRFNFTTGALSILGNLFFMKILVGHAHFHYLAANLMSIAACSILNFLISHHFVFRPVD